MTTVQRAVEILGGKNVFGPKEWLHWYKAESEKTNFINSGRPIIDEVPWDEADLRAPGINQPHFLFLGIPDLRSLPLNMNTWNEIKKHDYGGGFYRHSTLGYNPDTERYQKWLGILNNDFALRTCDFRWYLMTVNCVVGSTNLSYDQQIALLPNAYEVPSAIERITGNFLFHLLNRKFLDGKSNFSFTRDLTNDGFRIFVGPGTVFGLEVERSININIAGGIAASRKVTKELAENISRDKQENVSKNASIQGNSPFIDVDAMPASINISKKPVERSPQKPSVPNLTEPSMSNWAIMSLILSLFSFCTVSIFFSMPAVILGLIALYKLQQSEGKTKGNGIAWAGIIIGSANIMITMLVLFISVILILTNK
jgi:hypothetical protein